MTHVPKNQITGMYKKNALIIQTQSVRISYFFGMPVKDINKGLEFVKMNKEYKKESMDERKRRDLLVYTIALEEMYERFRLSFYNHREKKSIAPSYTISKLYRIKKELIDKTKKELCVKRKYVKRESKDLNTIKVTENNGK